MSNEESKSDVVREVRELLVKVTLPAEVNARCQELLPLLCNEVEALHAAVEAALPWIDAEIQTHQCALHDQPSHCVHCDLRHKAMAVAAQLRAALHPQPEERK